MTAPNTINAVYSSIRNENDTQFVQQLIFIIAFVILLRRWSFIFLFILPCIRLVSPIEFRRSLLARVFVGLRKQQKSSYEHFKRCKHGQLDIPSQLFAYFYRAELLWLLRHYYHQYFTIIGFSILFFYRCSTNSTNPSFEWLTADLLRTTRPHSRTFPRTRIYYAGGVSKSSYYYN